MLIHFRYLAIKFQEMEDKLQRERNRNRVSNENNDDKGNDDDEDNDDQVDTSTEGTTEDMSLLTANTFDIDDSSTVSVVSMID